ncbi:Protein containing two CBS domains (some fused to C-terminal double-stranded RNA-binding domain of RaiA family) [Halalkaliarchaeum sp. AArc-CO]|uniref:CBS domain-containing protein n=1 Tax=unclassified Halalkaliarchaeum TaxID=2678344 RepID=UPI00217E909F|nr:MULTISPECIES: CBS domain-containing protein [unclassified Halalkaliarchaeum]MDR5672045.1 CBS domain-containing protein [Halalkaliarchaeum sp. AArc-GB]UWG51543.1 Protein containing two CBS domains (some fused to C-terminal double-stranded RNA-binding domain of RaiA family) [Halalkaliarchaeum sp. AArc-CO]
MDIADIVSTEYVEFTPDARVSKLVGTFEDPSVKGVVVREEGGDVEGVVTRRQLASSYHPPDEKLGSLVWHVPQLAPDEDVRKVARLMTGSDSQFLPVIDGGELVGVVTADGVLGAVEPFLDSATVADVYSEDLVSVAPDSTFGEALHVLRDNRIAHLPVVDDGDAVGILSLYDVMGVVVRSEGKSQGGDAAGTDPFGGEIAHSAGRTRRGGYGAREGELARMLELPVRDVMVSPVRTIAPDRTLQEAVGEMFDVGGSALVVVDDGGANGIVTKTDVLEALTWEAEGTRAVQLYGSDLLDDMSYPEVVEMVDSFDQRDGNMTVLDARIHLHEHDETLRGTPLLLARIRLHTDRGLYMASGEGYGASHAIGEAREVLQRRIQDRKTYGKSKKPRDEEFWEKRFGWWLEG